MADNVEMSDYIPIDDYDSFEERHAYFVEMMAEMLAQFAAVRPRDGRGDLARGQVLELGAGTGHFTRRITAQPEVDCVAVEIDDVCFAKLSANLGARPNVTLRREDSVAFRPEGATRQFHGVFSSFSDHHIRPADRGRYFENVKRCLAPGGAFIVGDEFLPDHDPADEAAWRDALTSYHSHIIDVSRDSAERLTKEGRPDEAHAHHKLIQLETEALQSGLGRIGDFKVSRREYEESLTAHGLAFGSTKIGPLGRDDLGGVYVYVISAN